MESRISVVTLGVKDFKKSYDFYCTGLGFETNDKSTDPIAFFKTNGTELAIYPVDKLAEDISPEVPKQKSDFSGITLAHCVREKTDVNTVLKQAEQAGGKIVKPAQDTFWGGYGGYFSDPDGYYWEVAYFDNWKYDEHGHLVL
jgi:predicted lactoylglutathione lyase